MSAQAGIRRWGHWAGATAGLAVVVGVARRALAAEDRRGRRLLPGLPDGVLPTDVLDTVDQAEQHLRVSDELGLPLVVDPVNAWAALGALAALVRVVGDRDRPMTVVDLGGRWTALARWCRALGCRVARDLPAEPGSVDLIGRVHPSGATARDVDDLLPVAARALAPGGVLVVTVPVGDADAPGALGRADLRALEARAHALDLVLVGDLDGEVGRRLTAAVRGARQDAGTREAGSAYALARLTFRRR